MDSMKDWPVALKRNAAVCELAAAIYRARCEVFGGAGVLADQPPHVRAQYVTRADELLKTLAPRPVTDMAAVRSVTGRDFSSDLAHKGGSQS